MYFLMSKIKKSINKINNNISEIITLLQKLKSSIIFFYAYYYFYKKEELKVGRE